MYRARLELNYTNNETADIVFSSVNVDNDLYVSGKAIGSVVIFDIACRKSGTLRNTLDDLLSCISSIENIS